MIHVHSFVIDRSEFLCEFDTDTNTIVVCVGGAFNVCNLSNISDVFKPFFTGGIDRFGNLRCDGFSGNVEQLTDEFTHNVTAFITRINR